jgi:hypothetical protein
MLGRVDASRLEDRSPDPVERSQGVTKIASMTPLIAAREIIGTQVDGPPLSEAEHFWKCEACGGKSATESGEITATQRQWRKALVIAMAHHGFSNYSREWWHFSRQGRDPVLDFAIPENPPSSVSPDPTPANALDSKPAGH